MDTLRTACGGSLMITNEAEDHLMAHPDVWEILPEAVSRLHLPEAPRPLMSEVDLGRPVGYSGCIAAPRLAVSDVAHFALRKNRTWPSRVMEDVRTELVSTVVIWAAPLSGAMTYELSTAFIGTAAAREPWDPKIASEDEFQEALRFWSENALAYLPVIMGSVIETSWLGILMRSNSPWLPAT